MNLMERRRRIMQYSNGPILPPEYQRVEYIESTGTQYIQLPYGFDNTDKVTIKASIDTSYSTDKYIIAPTTWNDNSNRFAMVGVYQKYYVIGYGAASTGNTRFSPYTENDGNIHTWTYDDVTFKIPELNLSGSWNVNFGGTTTNLILFYGYRANSAGKLAYYKHIKLNSRYELLPCYRKADGVIGLYDIANDVFYTNDGTGTFVKGPNV